MYSRKTKTEIIGDLLVTVLDQFESGLEDEKGQCYGPTNKNSKQNEMEIMYENIGSRGHFWTLTEKHLRDLEQEAGITEPMKIPSSVICEYADSEEIS